MILVVRHKRSPHDFPLLSMSLPNVAESDRSSQDSTRLSAIPRVVLIPVRLDEVCCGMARRRAAIEVQASTGGPSLIAREREHAGEAGRCGQALRRGGSTMGRYVPNGAPWPAGAATCGGDRPFGRQRSHVSAPHGVRSRRQALPRAPGGASPPR